jgi:hypothetical protein
MLAIPSALQSQFDASMRNKAVPNQLQGDYKKWLRYYLDFYQKYRFPSDRQGSLPRFIQKLQEKKQTDEQRRQAIRAISLYYEIVKKDTMGGGFKFY